METTKEILKGTPNQKTLYQRLGLALEELQNQPFYKGKSIEIAKLANEMTKAYLAEMERCRLEKEMGRIEKVRDIELIELTIVDKQKMIS